MDFRQIIRDAAQRKLLDLAKVFLTILDELKHEEAAKVDKFISLAEEYGFGEQVIKMRPFLLSLDENKKNIVRKRILDKTNELARELDQ